MPEIDYNDLIPEKYRIRLNSQKNRLKLDAKFDHNGRIIHPYVFVVGLGEKHYKQFNREMQRFSERFPWITKKHVRFIINECIINSQFSMLRELVERVPRGEPMAGYFFVVIYICDQFFSAGIEEFGDYFDYFGYLEETLISDSPKKNDYDSLKEEHIGLSQLSRNHTKIILRENNRLVVPDGSNKIALRVIEKATDQDFYITSFFKDGLYMWKRIYFRIENN